MLLNKLMNRAAFVVAFAALAAGLAHGAETTAAAASPLYCLRAGLDNCRAVFDQTKHGRVAYLGGSITASPGWRDLTYELLKKRFPQTEFEFINAGIGGTNSSFGAFRLQEDVFGKGPVDLLFLEFAVNDEGGAAGDVTRIRAMEGIIRHARQINPALDILVLYFADTDKMEAFQKGETSGAIQDHEKVAEHYGIPVVYLAAEVKRRLDAKAFEWSQFSRDTCHPTELGHKLYAECINTLMNEAWGAPVAPDAKPVTRELPAPLDALNYEHGRFIALEQAKPANGWNRIAQWDTEKKCNYGGTVDVLAAETPGAALELDFEGTLIGISAIAGMDAGTLEASIDGGAPMKFDLFDGYCEQFHRPVSRVFGEGLPQGPHTLRLTISEEANPKSTGHAARILKFVAN